MQSQHSSLKELTVCSICLETFTRPKLLPCGHTYCYSCLIALATKGKGAQNLLTNVTCPQCRQVHNISEGGIAAFSENLVLNNLLPILQNESEGFCGDCELNPVVSKCKHCDKHVCSDCLIRHNDLLYMIRQKIVDLRGGLQSVEGKRSLKTNEAHIKESIDKLSSEMKNFTTTFDTMRLELDNQQIFFTNYFESVLKIYNDLLNAVQDKDGKDSYLAQLSETVFECKKIAELTELLNKVSDLETVLGVAAENSAPSLNFTKIDLTNVATVNVGSSVLNVYGNYGPGTSGPLFNHASKSEPQSDLGSGLEKLELNVDVKNEPVLCQNQLPTNVDYCMMGQRRISTIGHSKLSEGKLKSPLGMAYHHQRRELYVADYGVAVKVYDADGNGRIFYAGPDERTYKDVAVSNDGMYVYVVLVDELVKLCLDGKVLRRVNHDRLTNCRSVNIWEACVAVLEQDHHSIIIYDENLIFVTLFDLNHMKLPSAMAVSDEGKFYVTDDGKSCVVVFSRDGKYLCTFGRCDPGDSVGISVDGDGYVCVVRYKSCRIDVYNPNFELVTSFGHRQGLGCLKHPCRLLLTPSGRLLVSDRDNHRIQSF